MPKLKTIILTNLSDEYRKEVGNNMARLESVKTPVSVRFGTTGKGILRRPSKPDHSARRRQGFKRNPRRVMENRNASLFAGGNSGPVNLCQGPVTNRAGFIRQSNHVNPLLPKERKASYIRGKSLFNKTYNLYRR